VAPVAESVTDPTIQIAVGEAVAFIVGLAFTTSATVRVAVQPNPLAPVMVYVVDVAGETTTLVPVNAPGFQEYVVAPLPVRVADPPLQIAVGLEVALTVGFGFTTSAIVLVLLHAPFDPVTV
jgi:hypothetical protein